MSRRPKPRLKRTYTVPEAAAILDRTDRTVRRMVRAGLLRSIQAPGGRRVLAADIWAYLRWGRGAARERARLRGAG